MASTDIEDVMRTAIAQLKSQGVDTSLLDQRLEELVKGGVVGRWPPDSDNDLSPEQIIKMRSLIFETLELSVEKKRSDGGMDVLKDALGKVSDAMVRSGVGIGKFDLPTDFYRSIVGKWPFK